MAMNFDNVVLKLLQIWVGVHDLHSVMGETERIYF